MTSKLLSEVAFTMEAPNHLLPHLPYLLQDLPSLSGAHADVVSVLKEVGFPRGGTVLDLGCGRGDISILVAQAFDAKVTGIDGYPPFIETARLSASKEGLEQHCEFISADLRDWLTKPAHFDAVLMIAIGPVLGDPAKTVGRLRTVVREGGWIVIDDAYLESGVPPSSDYEGYLDQEATEAQLTQYGDALVARRILSPAGSEFNAIALDAIPMRAAELKTLHPDLEGSLDQYVARQIEEVALMDGPVIPALWAIQKT